MLCKRFVLSSAAAAADAAAAFWTVYSVVYVTTASGTPAVADMELHVDI